MKRLLCIGAILMAALAPRAAFADAPKSDDFKNGLASFWKVKQVTGTATYGTPTYVAKGGRLSLTSADNDVYQGTWEPYFIYQDGITGDFTMQVKILNLPQCSEWSGAGLMVSTTPIPDSYGSDPEGIPTWWLVHATRDHGSETKGGGQGKTRGVNINAGLQPPYWIRVDRQGPMLTLFNSTDGGKTWNQDGDPINMEDELGNQGFDVPFKDPLAVGIEDQTHCGATLDTAVLGPFEAGPLSDAGKLPGDAAAPATISGAVTDNKGGSVGAGLTVIATAADGSAAKTRTDTDGKYQMFLDPGDYTFSVDSPDFDVSGTVKATFTPGQTATQDLTVKPVPGVSLATADGATWDLAAGGASGDFGPADGGAAFAALGPASADVPTDVQSTVGPQSYFWYRTTVKLSPDVQAAKGQELFLSGYNLDDGDWAFFNGHFLGSLYNYSALRNWPIPSDWVNWTGDNTVVLKGFNGTGGAGITTSAGHLRLPKAGSGGTIYGVVTAGGKPLEGVKVAISNADGSVTQTATSSGIDGSYFIPNLPPGSYTVTPSGPSVVSANPASATVTVADVTAVAANFDVTAEAPLPAGDPDPAKSDKLDKDLSKWKDEDINAAGAGSAKIANGALTITGQGDDIWNMADAFHYVYQPVTGDFTAAVQVTSMAGFQAVNEWSKAELMVRASNAKDAAFVAAMESNAHGASIQYRPSNGAGASDSGGQYLDTRLPAWLILARKGMHVAAYASNFGNGFAKLGETDAPGLSGADVLIGLAVTSHDAMNPGSATFSDFRLWPNAFPMESTGMMGGGVPGDLNGDGKVDIKDATLSLQIAVGSLTPTATQTQLGDANKDGKLNIQDTTLILGAAVGIRTL